MKKLLSIWTVVAVVLVSSGLARADWVLGDLLDTIDVPAYSADLAPSYPPMVTSTTTLPSGRVYRLVVSGTYITIPGSPPGLEADAQYATNDQWAAYSDLVPGYASYGAGLCELYVDGSDVDWGEYSASHVYTLDYAGTGTTVNFRINDFYATNNSGSLTVEIYELILEVQIDIKPGSFPNSINSKPNGVIPVAILTTDTFDASTVDPSTVALEGVPAKEKGKSGECGSMEDVDGDGDLDLVVQIENDIEWASGATEATLTGETYDGIPIQGTDTVNIVPKGGKK